MSIILGHTVGCRCTECKCTHHPVSAEPPASLPALQVRHSLVLSSRTNSVKVNAIYQPLSEISQATDQNNKPETFRQTSADGVLIKTPSIVQYPSMPRKELAPSKGTFEAPKACSQPSIESVHNNPTDSPKPALPQFTELVIEEITSDDDFESASWSDAESDIDDKGSTSDAALLIPSKTPQVEVKPDVKVTTTALDASLIVPTKTPKVEVKQGRLSSSKPKQIGVAPEKADVSNNAPNTASKTPEVEIKRCNVFSDAGLKESFEKAMRMTFPAKVFDAMMADLKGDAALDDGAVDVKTIHQMLDGIDESHRKNRMPTLAELYPKRLSKPQATTEVKAESLKDRFADLNVKEERVKKLKEAAMTDQHEVEEIPTKYTAKAIPQAEVILEGPFGKGSAPENPYQDVKSRYLEPSPKF